MSTSHLVVVEMLDGQCLKIRFDLHHSSCKKAGTPFITDVTKVLTLFLLRSDLTNVIQIQRDEKNRKSDAVQDFKDAGVIQTRHSPDSNG